MSNNQIRVIVFLVLGFLISGSQNVYSKEIVFLSEEGTGNTSLFKPVEEVVYKKIGEVSLQMKIYYPNDYQRDKIYPTIVLFFGGGWISGSIDQLKPQAQQFASLGMIAVTPDYRVKSRNGTSPFESVRDARSAIRYLRENATKYGVDINKIAVGGGSAGGHLAAATDFIDLNEPNDDLTISAKPNALILFNPVLNNGPDGGYGYERFGNRYREISPFHNIKKGGAPTILFLGTKDALVPVETLQRYKTEMEANGNRCDLFLYENQKHGFFNYNDGKNPFYTQTMERAIAFLKSLGYL